MKNWKLKKPSKWYRNWYRFIEFNANPLGRRVGDDAIRALAVAFDMTWYDVYDEFCAIGRKNAEFGYTTKCISEFLKKRKTEEIEGDCHRWKTAKEFAAAHEKGSYVLLVGIDMSVMVDGCIYDTSDCTEDFVSKAWRVLE